MSNHRLKAVVVGAGHAGLNMSRALQQAGVEHVVFEKGRIGESWRAQRWDSFALNTPNWASGLIDFDPAGDEPEGFLSCEELITHLDEYAEQFRLPICEETAVVSVERLGDGFRVTTSDGSAWDADTVVVCSGSQNVPSIPSLTADLPASITQIHTADYRSPDRLPAGAVLVVGSGQSGAQVAEELAEAGRDTHLCTSAVGRIPRRYRGRDFVTWIHEMGATSTPVEDLEDPDERYAVPPMTSGVRGGHSISLHSLGRLGVTLLGRLEGVDGRTLHVGDQLVAHVALGDQQMNDLKTGIDRYIEAAGIYAPPADPDEADISCPTIDEMASIRSVDLDAAGITSVIWATGFHGDFSYLRFDIGLDEHGMPAHVGGVSPVAGLYYLGFPWLRTRSSGVIAGAAVDAIAVRDHIVGYAWPSEASPESSFVVH